MSEDDLDLVIATQNMEATKREMSEFEGEITIEKAPDIAQMILDQARENQRSRSILICIRRLLIAHQKGYSHEMPMDERILWWINGHFKHFNITDDWTYEDADKGDSK